MKSSLFSSTSLLSAHFAAIELMNLCKNILLARMLSPEDMGLIALWVIILKSAEMLFDFGVDKWILQSNEQSKNTLLNPVHTFQVFKGFTASLFLLCIGLSLTEISISHLIILSLIPLIRSFTHLDYLRMQKQREYRPLVLVELLSQLFSVGIGIVLLWNQFGVETFLYMLLLQQISSVWISHSVSETQYQIVADKIHIFSIISFGWSLAVNGIILFLIQQGDKIVISLNFPLEVLGKFAIAFQLALVPTLILTRVATSIVIPSLVANKQDSVRFYWSVEAFTLVINYLAITISLMYYMFINSFLSLAYGDQYLIDSSLCFALSLFLFLRIARISPTLTALSLGDSRNPMYTNLFRLSGYLFVGMALILGYGAAGILLSSCIGELVSWAASIYLLNARHAIPVVNSARPACLLLIVPVFLVSNGIALICLLIFGMSLALYTPKPFNTKLLTKTA